jgi:divinyl chlorophyllide a 8-vinyl-reductase
MPRRRWLGRIRARHRRRRRTPAPLRRRHRRQYWTTEIKNTITNDNSAANWCLGRPSTTTTTKTVPGQPAQTRTVGHTVDYANCRAKVETVEPNDTRLKVTTTFGFDLCGNTNSVSVVGLDPTGAALPARTTATNYSYSTARCALPEAVTNALNQTAIAKPATSPINMTALSDPSPSSAPRSRRVAVLGATGTIGRATVRTLLRRGREVVCFVRPRAGVGGMLAPEDSNKLLAGATVRFGQVTDLKCLGRDGFRGERFDALVSCMASRTGAPKDAWAIDHLAHVHALQAARNAGVTHLVLLSAICVQKPLLAFQHAKLAFERALVESGLTYSIVRPTAFFKSLSGQVERVKRGSPFLVFGDGTLTSCKPLSDDDLADYLAGCLDDASRWNRVLPIGGPGDAITPRQQAEHLFRLLGRAPRLRHVPLALLETLIGVLGTLGRFVPALAEKAELARIGRYYATESMLVLDPETGRYSAAATPSTGTETLYDFYAGRVSGAAAPERGDHAVF